MENPNFLKQKYNNLHTSPEVTSAVKRKDALNKEAGNNERVSQNPNERIQEYLNRLEHLILDPKKEQGRKETPDGSNRPRALSLLREMVMNEYVRPNKEKLAEGAAIVEERAARQIGINIEYNEDQLAERGEIAVKDLEGSLDQWISYLSDLNEPYPTWFRYYAFRNILELGEYDKDKQEFPKRTAGTNRLFPDIDRGALARIQDIIECSKDASILERFRNAQKSTDTPSDQLLTAEKAKAFANLSFAKQYTESMKEAGEITPEMRAETKGKWIKYGQDSDPTALWASLQNKGTAWCTKGFATAETQLKGGDFYVYYTLDKQGEPKIPRIAIRMQNGSISEARGVADSKQNLEGNMTEIAEKKMSELPGKEKYQKTSADMKKITAIYEKSFREDKKTGEKTYLNPELSKDELVFLYEINAEIDGFGYQRDPRIAEVRQTRNPREDASIVFECQPDQIAYGQEEYEQAAENKRIIKAYIGPLFPGIFSKSIEHLYVSFHEGRIGIERVAMAIGNKRKEEIIKELDDRAKLADADEDKIYISDHAQNMLNNPEFTVLKKPERINLVRLKVSDLGFTRKVLDGVMKSTTTQEIYKKAEELGLELCPSEVGPKLILNYEQVFNREQPRDDSLSIGMKPCDSLDSPCVFRVDRHSDGGRWLDGNWAGPESPLHLSDEFVFRARKLET